MINKQWWALQQGLILNKILLFDLWAVLAKTTLAKKKKKVILIQIFNNNTTIRVWPVNEMAQNEQENSTHFKNIKFYRSAFAN